MDRDTEYRSSIPAEACEKVTARYGKLGKKRAEYYIGQELVGIRQFHSKGALEGEWAFKNGVRHGMQYRWDHPGELLSCAPYENGRAHGIAYQWGKDGRLIGSYTMVMGTGIDLWWHGVSSEERAVLAEVHYERDGQSHGFEWWLNHDASLRRERHWQNGVQHGIEREWGHADGLRPDYPCYYLHGEQVTQQQYLEACIQDPTLPPFWPEDNAPH